jgi:VanZ family protein
MVLPYRFPRPVRLGLYVLAVAILFAICVAPSEKLPTSGAGDRFEHAAAWFVLTITGYALAPNRRLAIPAFALAFGVLIEAIQAIAPTGRHGDPLDVVADVVGVAAGVAAMLIARWAWARTQRA